MILPMADDTWKESVEPGPLAEQAGWNPDNQRHGIQNWHTSASSKARETSRSTLLLTLENGYQSICEPRACHVLRYCPKSMSPLQLLDSSDVSDL